MSEAASKALKAYEEKHEKKPKDAASLVAFVKTNKSLKPITIEEAEAVLNGGGSSSSSSGSEKKDSKHNEAKDDDEDSSKAVAAAAAASTKMETPLYAVGDEVLMSKDRVGVIRYVGAIPEMGPGLWYGVELMDGSIGQTDGVARGKRYFTTEGKRALFVPPLKIRRKLNEKDRKKHESMRFTQERKLTEPSSTTSTETSNKPASNDTAAPPSITTTEKAPVETQAKESTPPQSNSEEPSIDATKEPAIASDSPRRPSTLKQAIGISAAETYETLLIFILRQSEEVREQLLDVYASPQLHMILVSAYAELKNMEREEQELVWNALLTRWRRFG